MLRVWTLGVAILILLLIRIEIDGQQQSEPGLIAKKVKTDEGTAIQIFRKGNTKPVLTQVAAAEHRPFIHPIVSPTSEAILTENQPAHHRHQTGLFWGLTRVNGRDFFHHPGKSHWKRVSVTIDKREAKSKDDPVGWTTVYELLDKNGDSMLREEMAWTLKDHGDHFLIDLRWKAHALQNVKIDKYDYGGLFLRMPWGKDSNARVTNSARQFDQKANAQRAVWLDLAMNVKGQKQPAHVAIFDHPSNPWFPQPWRVDDQFGVGPSQSQMGDWSIAKNQTRSFRHQLVVYSGELNDVELTKKWSAFSGHSMPHAQWGLANREGRAARFLTPEDAVKAMTLQPGFEATVYAAEPTITQPMAFCWDDRGRLWVAENRDYETRQRGFSRYGDSRILILEDTDRDGKIDSRKVFAEGIPFPSAIAVGMGGVWVGAPPNLLFIPDSNQDDRADMEDIEVRLTGWGIRDRHETLNSFHWGPDGWLYGLQGFATPSRVGKPKGKGKLYRHQDPFPDKIEFEGPTHPINGGVWRYHPVKDRFEVVAHGFSNPWGIDYDAKGNLFITACVIPHLWHVIPGGLYHRQGGVHFNSHAYRDIQTIADHRHRSAHGGARIYQSDLFPEKYHDRIFMANIHEHAVLTDILKPRGSGFVGHHGDELLHANNAQWIGFSVEIGPDGAIYILDWHDADICGKEVLNKDTGRVFKIMPKDKQPKEWKHRFANLRTLKDLELVALQEAPSAWHRRRARLILAERASISKTLESKPVHAALKQMLQPERDANLRLRALWALHMTGGLDESFLFKSLQDRDQHIRAWSIQLLCEDRSPSDSTLKQFVQMAATDRSPVVRLYLAAALQRIPKPKRLSLIQRLVAHGDDADDHNLPLMIWFGLEPVIAEEPVEAVALVEHCQIPMINRFIARRLAHANRFDVVVDRIDREPEAMTRRQLLLGMRDAMEGRFNVNAPNQWPAVFEKLLGQGPAESQLAMQLAQQFGDRIATEALLKTLKTKTTSVVHRRQALRMLAVQHPPQLGKMIPDLIQEKSLRREAIRTAAAYDDAEIGKALLKHYDQLPVEEKLEVVQAMASRSGYARQLTEAIKNKTIPRRDIPAYLPRVLQRVVGNGFLEVWGRVDTLPEETEATFRKARGLLTDQALDKADLSRGRALFKKNCAVCHQLYGEGRKIGPDITGANRSNLDYLLGNIITPSAEIQDDYKTLIVLTDEGRMYSGIRAGENERQLRMWIANQDDPVVIAKSKIDSREIASVSTMPDGLLQELKDQEIIDLVAYLKSNRQVPLPKEKRP